MSAELLHAAAARLRTLPRRATDQAWIDILGEDFTAALAEILDQAGNACWMYGFFGLTAEGVAASEITAAKAIIRSPKILPLTLETDRLHLPITAQALA